MNIHNSHSGERSYAIDTVVFHLEPESASVKSKPESSRFDIKGEMATFCDHICIYANDYGK